MHAHLNAISHPLRIFVLEVLNIGTDHLEVNGPPCQNYFVSRYIPQGVGDNCYTFGIFFLNDQTGGQVDTFKEQYQGDTEGVVQRILWEWLEGKGLPVTWIHSSRH